MSKEKLAAEKYAGQMCGCDHPSAVPDDAPYEMCREECLEAAFLAGVQWARDQGIPYVGKLGEHMARTTIPTQGRPDPLSDNAQQW